MTTQPSGFAPAAWNTRPAGAPLVESQPFGHRVVLFAADALELLASMLHNRKLQLVIYKRRSDNA